MPGRWSSPNNAISRGLAVASTAVTRWHERRPLSTLVVRYPARLRRVELSARSSCRLRHECLERIRSGHLRLAPVGATRLRHHWYRSDSQTARPLCQDLTRNAGMNCGREFHNQEPRGRNQLVGTIGTSFDRTIPRKLVGHDQTTPIPKDLRTGMEGRKSFVAHPAIRRAQIVFTVAHGGQGLALRHQYGQHRRTDKAR